MNEQENVVNITKTGNENNMSFLLTFYLWNEMSTNFKLSNKTKCSSKLLIIKQSLILFCTWKILIVLAIQCFSHSI